jgi:hypothetical protein
LNVALWQNLELLATEIRVSHPFLANKTMEKEAIVPNGKRDYHQTTG